MSPSTHPAWGRFPRTLLSRRIIPILTVLIFGSSVMGQEQVVPPVPPGITGTESRVALPAYETGYWIVSTHASPQSFSHECPVFRPCVLRTDCGHGTFRASFADMYRSLTPGVPVCINVHGSFVTWQDVYHQSQLTWKWLRYASCGQPAQLINLTWPSDCPIISPTVNCDVTLLGRRAARNGWYLAELIRYIPPECPICLIGHSHGARLIASALHLMGGGSVQGVCHPASRPHGRRIRTVFAAAAIRHDSLNPGKRYGRAFCTTECLINLRNSRDIVLTLYPLRHPFAGRALGTTGFTRRDHRDLRGWSRRVYDYDVARWLGHRHMWPGYIRWPNLAILIRNYVYFPDQYKMAAASLTP